jgi:hypothetical protein
MTGLAETIIRYIDRRLDAMLRAPAMWGSDESVELQVLQLLELRALTVRPQDELQHPRATLDAYVAFLRRKFPKDPCTNLASLLEQTQKQEDLPRILSEFRQEMDERNQPEDVFATHDVVLRLWMREHVHVPRASMLSAYYDVFRRVLRAVSRPRGTRGRAGQDLEEAIDFAMPEVKVIPANGKLAHVVLPLDQIESSQAESVKQGLAHLVVVNEWAADSKSSIESLKQTLPDDGMPQRIAAQALRLMPSEEAAVQAVELGGKLIDRREPVTIRPSFAKRMLDVIKEGRAPREFDEVGSIRAVDIDQRSLRLLVAGQSLKCWMDDPELVELARRTLGHRVRAMGLLYKGQGSPPVVILSGISL